MANNCIIVVIDFERMTTTYLMFTRSSLSGVVVMVSLIIVVQYHLIKNGSIAA